MTGMSRTESEIWHVCVTIACVILVVITAYAVRGLELRLSDMQEEHERMLKKINNVYELTGDVIREVTLANMRAEEVQAENELLLELIGELERDNQALRETLLKASKAGVDVPF